LKLFRGESSAVSFVWGCCGIGWLGHRCLAAQALAVELLEELPLLVSQTLLI